jgi:hypothetical protein
MRGTVTRRNASRRTKKKKRREKRERRKKKKTVESNTDAWPQRPKKKAFCAFFLL